MKMMGFSSCSLSVSFNFIPRSMSMIDMRGEEELSLQPHSQVRHELMHNQYNRMKEEEDHWQDVSVKFRILSFSTYLLSSLSLQVSSSNTNQYFAVPQLNNWEQFSRSTAVLQVSSLLSRALPEIFFVPVRTWPDGKVGGGAFPRILLKKRRREKWWSS